LIVVSLDYLSINNQQLSTVKLFFSQLLYFIAVLDLVNENLGGFKAGNVMLIDHDGGIARNVAGNFFLSFLINETAKPANVNVVAASHVRFNDVKKCFNGSRNICFIDSCFFCDLIDYVCFGHGGIVYICIELFLKFRTANLNAVCSNAK
jgi:hypothetical protein